MAAYKTVEQAIRAALTPATPYYGSNTLASWTGGARGGSELTQQDRIAQAGMVYAYLTSITSPQERCIIAAKFIPAIDEATTAAKLEQCQLVATRLAAQNEADIGLTLDIMLREAGIEPVGSLSSDWSRWLDISTASVYRIAKRIRDAYNAELDHTLANISIHFIERGIIEA